MRRGGLIQSRKDIVKIVGFALDVRQTILAKLTLFDPPPETSCVPFSGPFPFIFAQLMKLSTQLLQSSKASLQCTRQRSAVRFQHRLAIQQFFSHIA
jgi:hypothetical protein